MIIFFEIIDTFLKLFFYLLFHLLVIPVQNHTIHPLKLYVAIFMPLFWIENVLFGNQFYD